MESWKKDARRDIAITDIEALVPTNHLLRKIEKVMEYDWIYEKLASAGFFWYNRGGGRGNGKLEEGRATGRSHHGY